MTRLPTLITALAALAIGGALGTVAYADQMHQPADPAQTPTQPRPMTGSGMMGGMMGGGMMGGGMMGGGMMGMMTQMNQMMQTCNQMMQQAMQTPAPGASDQQRPAAPAPFHD